MCQNCQLCAPPTRRHQLLRYQSSAIYNPRTKQSRRTSTSLSEISRHACSPEPYSVAPSQSHAPAAAPAAAAFATAPRRSPSPIGQQRPHRDRRQSERPCPGATGPAGCPEEGVPAAAGRDPGGRPRERGSGRGPCGRGGGTRNRAAGEWLLPPAARGWPEAAGGGRGGCRGAPWTDGRTRPARSASGGGGRGGSVALGVCSAGVGWWGA